jgi:hypothetical protein
MVHQRGFLLVGRARRLADAAKVRPIIDYRDNDVKADQRAITPYLAGVCSIPIDRLDNLTYPCT